jgi:hypothetical protein
MRISKQTPMNAEAIVGVDRDGAETYLLVVKGTFVIPHDGSTPILSSEQEPLTYADEYYGDAATTSIRSAGDFSLRKPMCDIVVVGSARTRPGERTRSILAGIQIGSAIRKVIRVVGNRHWERGAVGQFVPSEPEYFESMPLIYERAFGVTDTSHENPRRHTAHPANFVGVGLHTNSEPINVIGKLLPNLEHPDRPITSWGNSTRTMCFAFVSPPWQPRARYAGTYDPKWLEDRFPLLPDDFDEMYFQTAPADQMVAALLGDEQITLVNLTPEGRISFRLPSCRMPAVFIYSRRPEENHELKLDTLIIEPDRRRMHLVWRIAVRCIGKPYALQEIVVGDMSERWWRLRRSHKPYYSSIREFLRAKAAR